MHLSFISSPYEFNDVVALFDAGDLIADLGLRVKS